MIEFMVRRRKSEVWLLGLAVGISALASVASARPGARPRSGRAPTRVVTLREVIVRREPVVIQAVTLKQLRAELHRARMEHAGYERQIARQYQTIRHLQARLDVQLRSAQDTANHRAALLNAQFETILQAFGLVIFAIIGALLVALSRSQAAASRPVPPAAPGPEGEPPPPVDWDPLLHQLLDARSALASVEARLLRLETSAEGSRG
jgi:hypothetical protein